MSILDLSNGLVLQGSSLTVKIGLVALHVGVGLEVRPRIRCAHTLLVIYNQLIIGASLNFVLSSQRVILNIVVVLIEVILEVGSPLPWVESLLSQSVILAGHVTGLLLLLTLPSLHTRRAIIGLCNIIF